MLGEGVVAARAAVRLSVQEALALLRTLLQSAPVRRSLCSCGPEQRSQPVPSFSCQLTCPNRPHDNLLYGDNKDRPFLLSMTDLQSTHSPQSLRTSWIQSTLDVQIHSV